MKKIILFLALAVSAVAQTSPAVRGNISSGAITPGPASGGAATFSSVTVSGLPGGRIVFTGGGGVLSSSSTLLYSGGASAAAAGTINMFSLLPQWATTGTAAGTDFLLNETGTSYGSGLYAFSDYQIGGTSWYSFYHGNQASTGSFNSSSAVEIAARFQPTFSNQTGTAGWSVLTLNAVASGGGSGAKVLLDGQVGGVSQFSISNQGGVSVKQGTNARAGTFTLTAGAATVSNTSITANSVVWFCIKTVSGTITTAPFVASTVVGTSFTVSGSGTNNSTYNYIIMEAAP